MSSTFDSKASAEAELGRWKSLLPEAPERYRPSGKAPLVAYPMMFLGALLGVAAGAAGGAIVLAAGGVLVYLLARIAGFFIGLPIVFYVLVLVLMGLAMVSAFIAWLVMYAVVGGVAGGAVAVLAGKGKSRAPIVQSACGTLSALASVGVFFLFVQWGASSVSGDIPDFLRDMFGRGLPGLGDYDFGWFAWLNGLLGTGVALAMGAAVGRGVPKFCEECEEFMVVEKLDATSLECAERLLSCLREARTGELSRFYEPHGAGPIQVELYRCPTCDAGFLELKARFEARYQPLREKDPRTIEAQWRFACEPLAAAETRQFVEKGGAKDTIEQRGAGR